VHCSQLHTPAPSADLSPSHLLLYDGVCGLCDRLVQAVLARDRRGVFHFASLQSPAAKAVLERFGRTPDELNTIYVIVNYRAAAPTLLSRGSAALFVAEALEWPLARLLGVLPQRLVNWGYDLVARYRYRVFGRYDQCVIPCPEHRSRFVETVEDLGRGPT
jgi:predicted DCC family thiol-disulfide oxidoreductase YuxK